MHTVYHTLYHLSYVTVRHNSDATELKRQWCNFKHSREITVAQSVDVTVAGCRYVTVAHSGDVTVAHCSDVTVAHGSDVTVAHGSDVTVAHCSDITVAQSSDVTVCKYMVYIVCIFIYKVTQSLPNTTFLNNEKTEDQRKKTPQQSGYNVTEDMTQTSQHTVSMLMASYGLQNILFIDIKGMLVTLCIDRSFF